MEARPLDRLLRVDAFVEDPGRGEEQRRPQAGASRGADRQLEAAGIDEEARGHHALHPRARLQRAVQQVGLAEHAVQVQVEAGEEVARAEAEARRQDAHASLSVRRDEVRRVSAVRRPRRVAQRVQDREHPGSLAAA